MQEITVGAGQSQSALTLWRGMFFGKGVAGGCGRDMSQDASTSSFSQWLPETLAAALPLKPTASSIFIMVSLVLHLKKDLVLLRMLQASRTKMIRGLEHFH